MLHTRSAGICVPKEQLTPRQIEPDVAQDLEWRLPKELTEMFLQCPGGDALAFATPPI